MQEENTYPNPFSSFILRLVALVTLAVVTLALIAAWHTFLLAAPIIVQVLVILLLLAIVGALAYLAIDKGMDIRSKHLAERRRNELHSVHLHIQQSRIYSDERGNKPSLLTASGTVVNLPSGNYVQPVSAHYAPHIVHNYPKTPGTTVQEVSNVEAALPSPTVPTFAQLLQSGETRPHEVQSILGYTDGNPRRGDWDKLHSFFVVGLSGSGKSSTVAYFVALAVMHGARLLVIDPDAEEEQSITKRIAPLNFALLTPVVSSPQGVQRVLDIAQREIASPSNFPIVWIVDEFSTLMRDPEWASVAPQLAISIENYAQRGRKRNRTAIVLGQVAKATRTGGTELRDSMTATFVHRLPVKQARLVIDSDTASAAPTLADGEVLVQLANVAEPYKMQIPLTTLDDMDTVQSMMVGRSDSVLRRSSGILTPFPDRSTTSSMNAPRTDVNALENDVERMRTLILASGGKPSKRAILMEVYGVRPGGSPAWQEASQKYDAIIAEMEAEKEEA